MNRRSQIRVLAGIITAVIALSGCDIRVEVKRPFATKQVTAYDRDDTKKTELTCVYRADMPSIPFVDVEQYLDLVYCEDADYTLTGSGNRYRVFGKNKNTGKIGKSLLIDTADDTLTFDGYNGFVVGKSDGTVADYVQMTDESTDEDPVLTYDLSRYDIDIVAQRGHVYMPLSTLSDILNNSLTYADTIDGNIYLTREDSFTSDPTEYVADLEKTYYDTLERSADVAEFSYDELCFVLDNLYGSPGRARSQEFVRSLSSIGLDETLEQGKVIDGIDLKQIKQYLTSTSKAEYAQGLFMLDNLLYDGGHTFLSYSFYNTLSNDAHWDQTEFSAGYLEEFGHDRKINTTLYKLSRLCLQDCYLGDTLIEMRDKGFGPPEKTWNGDHEESVASLYVFGNTAVFSFDEFTDDVLIASSGEKPFNEALEYASEKNCENFILDLSTNGGGSDQTMGYILSMIYGQDAPYYRLDVDTGFHRLDVFTADKNLDGIIDEEDEKVRYDFNYAIMISKYSFSCANALPNLAHEKGVPLLGCATSGGACNVSTFALPGQCNSYSLSSTLLITDSAYQSVDPGIEPDYRMLTVSEDGTVTGTLYDPDELISTLDRHYGKEIFSSLR